ncbi:MAG TPA: DUF58 domain-containing protein [Sporichthya sp.]|nr:DUF58 domain-containing protein [Sporichthya sp.]
MGTAAPLTADRVLRRLEWHVIRRLDGRLQGNYRTLLRGHGTDFRDVREYEVGDDVRHVDWNVTARMDEMFVRQYTEDRELTAWLLLDHSASMSFGPTHRTKERVLSEVAATIAQLLVRTGNKIGAIVYDNDVVRTIPPRQGRPQVLRLLDELLRPAGGGGMVTDLRKLLDTAARQIRRRSLVVIVSDFISEPGWERSLLRLTERHEVVAVRLVDPRELELPDAGLLVVQDAETGEQLMVDSSDPVFRRRLRDAGEARAEAVRAAALGAGVDLHVISTDDDLVTAFVRIVDSRKRPRR